MLSNPPEVALESRLRDYGLRQSSWEDGLKAFRAAIAVFPKELASTLIAFSLLPVVQRFFPTAAPKPALHLVGTTGSGKSEIAALMTSFYGQFTRDTPPAQWGDTVNTVEALGYTLADALYWVDDYKTCYADERTFTRFLQSYSRGMGRGRLTREAKLRQERPCRGLLLSTGETTIEGEASILSRMLVLEVPPWEKRDPGGEEAGASGSAARASARFHRRIRSVDRRTSRCGNAHATTLPNATRATRQGYRDQLQAKLGRQANTGRMVNNWAVLVSGVPTAARLSERARCGRRLTAMAGCYRRDSQGGAAGACWTSVSRQADAAGRQWSRDVRQQYAAPGRTTTGRDDHRLSWTSRMSCCCLTLPFRRWHAAVR